MYIDENIHQTQMQIWLMKKSVDFVFDGRR